ncbi:ClpP/crotonase-like domain protein [Vibrio phage 1.161.O._10N.261.48.C5]|nr:ClpP/crotonase-like domain protein [Vibrio phage 1.161.O._10N.261.48.C5]
MSEDTPKMAIRTSSRTLATEYNIMFDRTFSTPADHHEEVYMMRQAGEGDLVNLHINSGGGALVTFSAVQNVMKNSEAHFHAILEGDASSAASMLFLIADSQEVADHAEMMIHQAQLSYGSHAQGFKGAADMIAYQNEKLVYEVYKDFLNEKEIEKVLNGGEIWLHADQIRDRLARREQVRNQQVIEETKETYTPEVYATQCVLDITEDCEAFGYDPVEVIKEMLEQAFENQETRSCGCESVKEGVEEETTFIKEELESNICWDGESVFIEGASYRLETATRDDLVWIASELEVSHAWNISEDKLRQRILDFLNGED